MKKYIPILIILLITIIIFPSCNKKELSDNPQDSITENNTYSIKTDEELSSVLSDMSISNYERTEIISKMADEEINRAERYKKLIKEEYKERETDGIGYGSFSFDSANQTLDEYCEYLENEFNNNIEFFNNFAVVKFQGGTYGSIWKTEKEYECAKNYADKMQALYEYLS